jgi:hypothetical protein
MSSSDEEGSSGAGIVRGRKNALHRVAVTRKSSTLVDDDAMPDEIATTMTATTKAGASTSTAPSGKKRSRKEISLGDGDASSHAALEQSAASTSAAAGIAPPLSVSALRALQKARAATISASLAAAGAVSSKQREPDLSASLATRKTKASSTGGERAVES